MVGMIRTTLVEIVIDMTKYVPLDKLPSQAKVDSVVQVHIGSKDEYQISVGTNQGVVGQGPGSTQIQNNSVPTELTTLISQIREAVAEIVDPEQRADAEQAVDDFDEAVTEDNPEPEKVKRRSRALERVTTAIGSAVLTQVAKDGVALAAEHFHLLT
jgi:rRNA maturation endonuclease Nob1